MRLLTGAGKYTNNYFLPIQPYNFDNSFEKYCPAVRLTKIIQLLPGRQLNHHKQFLKGYAGDSHCQQNHSRKF